MVRRFSKTFCFVSFASLCMVIGTTLESVSAAAQVSNAAHGTKAIIAPGTKAAGTKKEFKFETISIRPIKPGISQQDMGGPMGNTSPSPYGFATTLPIGPMLLLAYAPGDQPLNTIPMLKGPAWLYSNDQAWYAINARIADADREAWRNQSSRHELLRAAMRDLLKERCKLVIQEMPTELPDYKLVIGKKGLQGLKVHVPGSTLPKGFNLPSGGVRINEGPRERTTWHFYGASMGDIVDFLTTGTQSRIVHDETGLYGRYDFAMKMIENPMHEQEEQIYNWPVAPLGLDLKLGKYPGFKLVIAHLEKPSPN